jgi:hypothetical protein
MKIPRHYTLKGHLIRIAIWIIAIVATIEFALMFIRLVSSEMERIPKWWTCRESFRSASLSPP